MVDVHKTIGTVTEFSYRLGHRVTSLPDPNTDNPDFTRIRIQNQSDRTFSVLIPNEEDYCLVEYRFDLAVNFARQMDEDRVGHYLNSPLAADIDIQDNQIRAAVARIEIEHQDELNDIWPDLKSSQRSTGLNTDPITTPGGTFAGFSVTKRIFPGEDDFSIRWYNECARDVTIAGEQGLELLAQETDVFDDDVEPKDIEREGTEIQFRTFQ